MTGGAVCVNRRPEKALLAIGLMLLLFGVSVYFTHRMLSRKVTEEERPRNRESLLLAISRRPSFAFGFRNAFADVAWLEAVQVAGARVMSAGEYDRLASLIEAVINFDPKFDVPYLMGGIVLGGSPAHVTDALKVLERGKSEFPSMWRLPFYEGYIRYFSQGDPVAGGMALEAAARIPGSPPYLPLLAARMLAEGRRSETALQFLAALAREESDPTRLRALEERMRDVETERDLLGLEKAVRRYHEIRGTAPGALSDLVSSGIIARIPDEPRGGRYLLGPDGSVRSTRLIRRLKVLRPNALK